MVWGRECSEPSNSPYWGRLLEKIPSIRLPKKIGVNWKSRSTLRMILTFGGSSRSAKSLDTRVEYTPLLSNAPLYAQVSSGLCVCSFAPSLLALRLVSSLKCRPLPFLGKQRSIFSLGLCLCCCSSLFCRHPTKHSPTNPLNEKQRMSPQRALPLELFGLIHVACMYGTN